MSWPNSMGEIETGVKNDLQSCDRQGIRSPQEVRSAQWHGVNRSVLPEVYVVGFRFIFFIFSFDRLAELGVIDASLLPSRST